jgi:acyl carrier protein
MTRAARGVEIRTVLGDATRASDVDTAVRLAGPRLRGFVHAAGVLDDGVLANLDGEKLARVMAPKTRGAWNLYRATERVPLDFAVLFSSIASMPGSAGQANYAAGNAFLDALAGYARAAHRTTVSINWGPWSTDGMAAGLSDAAKRRWAARAIDFIAPDVALDALERAILGAEPQVVIAAADWERYHRETAVSGTRRPLVDASASPETARLQLIDSIQHVAARVLGLPDGEAVESAKSFFDVGMDSLLALEFRNRLESEFGLTLPSTVVFDHPTPRAMADELLERRRPAHDVASRLADKLSEIRRGGWV